MNKRISEVRSILGKLYITGEITKTKCNHLQIVSPQLKRKVITSSTPSDVRTNLNLRSELKGALVSPLIKKQGRVIVSEIEKAEILTMLNEGKTAKELSEIYGYGKSSISKWKSDHNKANKAKASTIQQARSIDDIQVSTGVEGKMFEKAIDVFTGAKDTIVRLEKDLEWTRAERDLLKTEVEELRSKLALIAETMSL